MSDFTLPTSRPVTQDWAQDFSWLNGVYYPNGFYSSLGWKGHNGIDYGCWVGDEVEAVCDGVIEYVGPGNGHPLLSGGGNVILLRSDKYQMRFEYLHLSQQNVYTTQRVTKGQVIGLSGNTGVSTAPHLHLGAIPVGNVNQNDGWRGRVDPTPYLYGTIAPQGTITPQEEDVPNTPMELQEAVQTVLKQNPIVMGGRSVVQGINQSLLGIDVVNANIAQLKTFIAQQLTPAAEVKDESSTYYLKGDKKPEVYALDIATGKLRHVQFAEFDVVTAIGIFKEVPQAKVDALLTEGK